jgi:hypothetical protein
MVGGAGVATGVGGMNGAGARSRSGVGGGLTMSGAMTVWTRYQTSLVLTFYAFLSLLSLTKDIYVALLTLDEFVDLQTHPSASSTVERLLVQLLRLCEVFRENTFYI